MEKANTLEDQNAIKALEYLKSVLVAGEALESWVIQRRLFTLTHRRTITTNDK